MYFFVEADRTVNPPLKGIDLETMKKKFVVFAFVLAAFAAVASGCHVGQNYIAGYSHHAWRGY
jgi:hypothetical protein